MRAHKDRNRALLAGLLLTAMAVALAGVGLAHQGQQQQGRQQQQQGQKQGQQQQQQGQKADEKKGGGLFGGVKAVDSMRSSNESQLTASGGAKGVGPGDGKKIAAATPTAEDRQKVERMAAAAPTSEEMKQFLEQGHLSTKKGGTQ
jgi:transcription initiation factor TFIID subunit TAF12